MLILTHQYVFCRSTDKHFRVNTGSGMGQILSGDLADLNLFQMIEASFANLSFIRKAHHIHMYCRYRDDILIMYAKTQDEKASQFIRKVIASAKSVYKLSCESVGEACDYLDIHVYKPSHFMQSGRLGYRPYIKDSAQKVPLSNTSVHDPSIHAAWPLAEAKRMYRRSSTYRDFCVARHELAKTLTYFSCRPKSVG